MKKVYLFSFLLIFGLFISQTLSFFSLDKIKSAEMLITSITLVCLAFIMIHVGLEFSIDKSRLKSYGWDYFVAFTAATFPWIFCTVYFIFFFHHDPKVSRYDLWIEALLLARFAAPTSAGILFAMLAAADLEDTWVYKKARILAIFDDLDTIILLIPIKMLIVGFKWESILLLLIIGGLIYLAWKRLHSYILPINWYLVLIYSLIITIICESIYVITYYLEDVTPLHIEILLPAFVVGCILAYPKEGIHAFFNRRSERLAKYVIAAIFMFFVGMSMPAIEGILNSDTSGISVKQVIFHVAAITVLSNVGKMFPLFCYRKEASLRERLALSIGMCPRGEVGAGVIIVSLGIITHIDKSLIIIAMLSLIVNLILTGPFIIIIKKLLSNNKNDALSVELK